MVLTEHYLFFIVGFLIGILTVLIYAVSDNDGDND